MILVPVLVPVLVLVLVLVLVQAESGTGIVTEREPSRGPHWQRQKSRLPT